MIENSLDDKNRNTADGGSMDLLTPENTSKIDTVTELWSLAKIVKDIDGDPIWEALFRAGCRPQRLYYGYMFFYKGLTGIYFTKENRSGTVRFAIPKLIDLTEANFNEITEKVNVANSMIAESKYVVIGNEAWLIHERFMSANDDYKIVVEHILENLKSGVELFHKIC